MAVRIPGKDRPACYLGMPCYPGAAHPAAVQAVSMNVSRKRHVVGGMITGSLLGHSCNWLWCQALNARKQYGGRLRYFAMLHADMQPGLAWWLDVLIDELEATGADLLSAVAPIKNNLGLTSTAIDDPGNPWHPLKRLTLHEVFGIPETFSSADAGHPDRSLLVNTGCFVCRFDAPWVEKVCFTIRDQIVQDDQGGFHPQFQSEDWDFSRQLNALGLRVLATRKLPVVHYGHQGFGTERPWGECLTDPDANP